MAAPPARHGRVIHDGTRPRQMTTRQTYDFNSSLITWIQERRYMTDPSDYPILFPFSEYAKDILPQFATKDNPATGICTKFVASIKNKNATIIKKVRWNPEGRRVVTGCQNGEIALWNGFTFNFETTTQCHDTEVSALEWTRSGNWLVTGDANGLVKYWEPSMNNVKEFQPHMSKIYSISLSPTDLLFATSSRDQTISIIDFENASPICHLTGHGGEVKQVSWHNTQSLLISGSRDRTIKLWDPRSASNICSLDGMSGEVSSACWGTNNYWWATTGMDGSCKLWDVRTLRPFNEIVVAPNVAASCIAWHPVHEQQLAVGCRNGNIYHLHTLSKQPVGCITTAHTAHNSGDVWDLHWNPLGHILVSNGSDQQAHFWAQNLPGDSMNDRYNASQLPTKERLEAIQSLHEAMQRSSNAMTLDLSDDREVDMPFIHDQPAAPDTGGIPGLDKSFYPVPGHVLPPPSSVSASLPPTLDHQEQEVKSSAPRRVMDDRDAATASNAPNRMPPSGEHQHRQGPYPPQQRGPVHRPPNQQQHHDHGNFHQPQPSQPHMNPPQHSRPPPQPHHQYPGQFPPPGHVPGRQAPPPGPAQRPPGQYQYPPGQYHQPPPQQPGQQQRPPHPHQQRHPHQPGQPPPPGYPPAQYNRPPQPNQQWGPQPPFQQHQPHPPQQPHPPPPQQQQPHQQNQPQATQGSFFAQNQNPPPQAGQQAPRGGFFGQQQQQQQQHQQQQQQQQQPPQARQPPKKGFFG